MADLGPDEVIQSVQWPGVPVAESCRGTISHGISPATFILITYPQVSAPADHGNLALSDGPHAVVLRGCRVSRITGSMGPSGQSWTLEIQDRRWQWRGLGGISGSYNQLDPHGKLIPWTIRSPEELAILCLTAMGETDYEIDLPRGLRQVDGANLDRYLQLGENFRQSLANPPVTWDHTPPAEALARLCDSYGRRVIYQPISDRVLIAPIGVGAQLPKAPIEVETPALSAPPLPEAVAVAGAYTRFQARFLLEAVGKEWDGSYVPIDDLSYAPRSEPKVQITTVTMTAPNGADSTIRLEIVLPPPAGAPAGRPIIRKFIAGGVGVPDFLAVSSLADAINAEPAFRGVLTASAANNVLTITGVIPGAPYTVIIAASIPPTTILGATTQVPKLDTPNWAYSGPPGFYMVRQTERLSYTEAKNFASESVYRCYRITLLNPATGVGPLIIPGYGRVTRRQQIVLQPTKVEQIVPEPPNFAGNQKGGPLQPILPDFYNGYSRDQPAMVYGSVCGRTVSVLWNGSHFNTPPDSRVYASFTIDPIEQMVVFSDFVYRQDGSGLYPARLVLETACNVSNPVTGEVVRGEWALSLGGTAPVEWEIRDDVPSEIIGIYEKNHVLKKVKIVSSTDANPRAKYYLSGMAAPHEATPGESRQYIGIARIDPDGAIQQVTWSVGRSGPSTTASMNCEHSIAVPPYPARRRAENLPPNAFAILASQTARNTSSMTNGQANLAGAALAANRPRP